MHLLKEVLRLTAAGLSQRQIARSLKLSNGVVAKYQAAGRRAGLSWPLPEALDDVALANRLCAKPAESAPAAHVAPDFASIHEQLKEKGVMRLCSGKSIAPRTRTRASVIHSSAFIISSGSRV